MNEKRILVAPYEGDDAFIFVSYSHRNRDDALMIVERLQRDGYRVWYDEGIHPGSEWDEYIARYVANCTLFLALLSDEYLKSSNCKDELNYARNKEKNRVLIYLNDIDLPAGMELRLSRLQNIHKTNYVDEDSFYKKLYTSSGIETCRKKVTDNSPKIYLYNNRTSMKMHLEYGTHLIGRNNKKCNIFVDDNKASLVHAILSVGKDLVTLRDLYSTNRVFVNGKMIDPNVEIKLSDKDSILIGDTELILTYKTTENEKMIHELSDVEEIHNKEPGRDIIGVHEEIGKRLKQENATGVVTIDYAEKHNNTPNKNMGRTKEKTKPKKTNNAKENTYFFGAKKAKKLFHTIPEILELPEKTDIVLSDAFRNVVLGDVANVKKVVIPVGVREIQEGAFRQLKIKETIIIPDSVSVIGDEAFYLDDDAYVTCSIGSKAYGYCKQNDIKNIVDIAIWKQYGKCQHCGGDLSFLFRKCKNCGRRKDY